MGKPISSGKMTACEKGGCYSAGANAEGPHTMGNKRILQQINVCIKEHKSFVVNQLYPMNSFHLSQCFLIPLSVLVIPFPHLPPHQRPIQPSS